MSGRTEEETGRNIYKNDSDGEFDDDFDDESGAEFDGRFGRESDDGFDDDFDDDDFDDDDFFDELEDFPKEKERTSVRREKKAPLMSEKKTKKDSNALQEISRRMRKSASMFAELKEKVIASDFDEDEFDEDDFDEAVDDGADEVSEEEAADTSGKGFEEDIKAEDGTNGKNKTFKKEKSAGKARSDAEDSFDEFDDFDDFEGSGEFEDLDDLDNLPVKTGRKKNIRKASLTAGSRSTRKKTGRSGIESGQDRYRKRIALAGIACLIIIALVASVVSVVRAVRARQAAIYAEQHKPAENAITLVTSPADDLVDKTKDISGGVVYLTFDDGPSSDVTVEILDILKANNVKATFFICPYTEDRLPILQRMLEEGHCIGIHGNHEYDEIYASEDAFMSYYYEFHDKVKEDLGYDAFCMRFPGGSSNTISRRYCEGVMTALTERMNREGIMYVDWNVSSGDAEADGVPSDTIIQNIKNELQPGKQNVILMHDTSAKQTTADALQSIIDYCNEQGFLFSEIKPTTPASHHPVNN